MPESLKNIKSPGWFGHVGLRNLPEGQPDAQ